MMLFKGDCLEVLKDIPDGSVDAVIADPPYSETRAKWDTVIPFERLWIELKRVVKDDGAIVLFGNEPFSSHLRLSNLEMYRYDWKWMKNRATGFANCNYRPMRKYEDIMVFSKANASAGGKSNPMKYRPQGLIPVYRVKKNTPKRKGLISLNNNNLGLDNLLNGDSEYVQSWTNYPDNVLRFDCETKYVHPTQKPVALMEYLVSTYTDEGDTVLDFCMGSGTTGVACKKLNRNFIGIEKEEKYFEVARGRLVEQ